jgi:hypothetical protein
MKFIRLVHDILREIFEEAAYERFCAINRISRSASSYRRFLRESTCKTRPKAKCC